MKITKYMKETLNDVKAMLSTGKNLNNGIWLVGRAGSGKSTIGEYVANELNLPFKSISINASTDPIEFWGYKDVHGVYQEPAMISIYRNGGVYLIDEIDNGNANTLAGMNRIISQTKLDLANGECITKNKNFIIIATANTTGDGGDSKYRGRCAIDKATIDRFIMQEVKYDDALEIELANNKKDVVEFNKLVRKWVDKQELDYLVTPRTSEQLSMLLYSAKAKFKQAILKTTFKGWEKNDIKCCLNEQPILELCQKIEENISQQENYLGKDENNSNENTENESSNKNSGSTMEKILKQLSDIKTYNRKDNENSTKADNKNNQNTDGDNLTKVFGPYGDQEENGVPGIFQTNTKVERTKFDPKDIMDELEGN